MVRMVQIVWPVLASELFTAALRSRSIDAARFSGEFARIDPPVSSQSLRLEPNEHRARKLGPAVIVGQRMAAPFELLQFGDRGRIAVTLEARLRRDVRHRVVSRPGYQQQRATGAVLHVHLAGRV